MGKDMCQDTYQSKEQPVSIKGGFFMRSRTKTYQLALTGMLIAIGIVIPMFSPIKVVIEPASFTLASHVAVFIAMFISPSMAGSSIAWNYIGLFPGWFPADCCTARTDPRRFCTGGSALPAKERLCTDCFGQILLAVFAVYRYPARSM